MPVRWISTGPSRIGSPYRTSAGCTLPPAVVSPVAGDDELARHGGRPPLPLSKLVRAVSALVHHLPLFGPNDKAQQRRPRREPWNSEKPPSRPPSAAAPRSALAFWTPRSRVP